MKLRSKQYELLEQVVHGCCLSWVFQLCAGSEEIHWIATKFVVFRICPLGKHEASAPVQII